MSRGSTNTSHHPNQLTEGLLISIKHLIPSVTVKYRGGAKASLKKGGFFIKSTSGETGGIFDTSTFTLWFDLLHGGTGTIIISRSPIPLTPLEMSVLGKLPDALAGLTVKAASKSLEAVQRISGRISLEHLWLTKYLRKLKVSNLWTPALILLALQELSFRRYEDHRCTSGFVYTSKPQLYIPEVAHTPYELITFAKPVTLTNYFFEKPSAFRYVDGRNGFYLIDNWQRVYGVLRASDPSAFDIIARSSQSHVAPLVEKMPGRTWSAFLGNNDDVNVYTQKGAHFRWQQNHWHLRDKSILESILLQHGCTLQLTRTLCPVIYALSDLRFGTVLLIPDAPSNLPPKIGVIDDSELGIELRNSFLKESFDKLVCSHAIIGVLSSDGLTTVTKQGDIIGCGDIIDISSALGSGISGGGRTHAAKAASLYGLAIKVSEDGPISVFLHSKDLITL